MKVPLSKVYKISELNTQLGSVDISVSVLAKGPAQEVKRETGEPVKVARLIVGDETGIVSISLWDDKAELVNQLVDGETIELRGATVRERLGEISLNLGRSGNLQKVARKVEVRPLTKLNSLQNGKGLLIVEGAVSDQPLARQVVTDKGETINLASFTLRDDTGAAKVTFWRDQVDAVTKLRSGSRVKITGLRVRTGLAGELELTSIPVTKIEAVSQPISERPAWEDIRHVIALEPGLETWVKGIILDTIGEQKLEAHCETCGSLLEVSDSGFSCKTCKTKRAGSIVFSGRFKIDDGTGVAEVVFSGIDASIVVSVDSARERLLKSAATELVVNKEDSTLIGKEIEVYGIAQPTGTQARFEITAKKVNLVAKS